MSFHPFVNKQKIMLENLDRWIEKAQAFAAAKKFDANSLLTARLAPDQYPLVSQIRSACDTAKFGAARLAGKEAPKHPDDETTFEQLRARIKDVVAYLGTFQPRDFDGAAERDIELSYMPGKIFKAAEWYIDLGHPNFYFHVTHCYAIFRHNGVELGKYDYIGASSLRMRDR
jgi:uncharacterized protein